MKKRSSILVALAASSVLAVPAAASAAAGVPVKAPTGGTSSGPSAAGAATLSFRGMNLKLPAGWRVHRSGDGAVVTTGSCRRPEPFAANCRSFWVFGPKEFVRVPVGGGHITYTGKYQFHPFSGVVPCPFNAGTSWYTTGKATSKGLRPAGPGHKAKYVAWANRCMTNDGKKQTASFTQREWFLPSSKILVVDVWKTPGLENVLGNATWS
ncbi:hypothetical protein FHS43_005265 [Streptosporangium becharense]|uniref:Serine/threonine protein kinase n=1 Tax=Streptosporangium becharense TaxID=1816182 RepID=A0A7W9MIC1_9ACTN|nr:hypothetical protein [Streptosporangium becharense]MBB2913956.1 hypothetical protein [Streptosporangium becharense]MBB5821383.1 hypothetical protein [Streptosporangium becharense]